MKNVCKHPGANAGFSMVETMVGLLIGMVGVVVIMQVFALSEAQRRTITGGGDAQTSGAVALQILQRDIRMSGHGWPIFNMAGCGLLLPNGVTLNTMAPLVINDANMVPAGDPNTDTVLILYGNGNSLPKGDPINASAPSGANYVYTLNFPTVAVGDRAIAIPQGMVNGSQPSPCTLILATVTAVAQTAVGPPPVNSVTVSSGLAAANGRLYGFGPTPVARAYAVRNGNLTVCDYMVNNCADAAKVGDAAVWVPIAGSIVSLRAQYGRDTRASPLPPSPDGTIYPIVDLYDRSTPPLNVPDPANAKYKAQCGWVRIAAVRLALVARSSQFEKDDGAGGNQQVTAKAPTWTGSTAGNPAGSEADPFDLSKNPDGSDNKDWQNYRYKVFETVVPIRNPIWQGVNSRCN